MRHTLFLFLAALLLTASSCNLFKKTTASSADVAPAQYSSVSKGGNAQADYIQNFKNAAMLEMERGGVPASIILAQGLLESAAGQSELALQANNHFGVKCGSSWKGKTYKKQDDDRDKEGNLIESCFRKYDKVSDSYYDHGEFLRDPKKANRYGFLFNLDRTDYKGWARGLQSAGYATSGDYADRLINLIERYQLYEYDRGGGASVLQPGSPVKPVEPGQSGQTNQPTGSTGNPNNPQLPPLQRIGRVNDVKVVLTYPGESLDEIARTYRISTEKVVDYNERHYPPGFKLKENTRIFIQEKRSKWAGRASEHFVQEGQTMFDISQQYGICLDKLRSRNGLRAGEEPAIGEKIKLKGSRKKSDVVRLRDTSNDPKNDPAWPTSQPGSKPATTPPGKMTTDPDILFEIEGNEAGNKPATTSQPPATTTSQPSTPPAPPRPATTNGTPPVPYNPTEPDKQTQPGNNTWQPTQPAVQVPNGYHLVQKGETLYALSRKYNVPVPKLRTLNNLKNDNIQAGQMLRVQ